MKQPSNDELRLAGNPQRRLPQQPRLFPRLSTAPTFVGLFFVPYAYPPFLSKSELTVSNSRTARVRIKRGRRDKRTSEELNLSPLALLA
jgi:hypothetical protein